MISFIKGQIVAKSENSIIVETSGIGYEIFVSNNTLVDVGEIDQDCLIYTYLQVRDDGMNLFGFSSIEEKNMFNLLISVSGVGAKLAIGILSGMKLTELTSTIACQDCKILQTIKGLGKKTAERVILELKDKVNPALSVRNIPKTEEPSEAVIEAIQALLSLGLTKNESVKLAKENAKNNQTAEEIVKCALQSMVK
jgi:Holliday junction DNA helicase RuvA